MDELWRVQIDRKRVTEAIAPANCPPGATGLAVAYSGGPDSTVLLHAIVHGGHDVPVRALHVCHHLQPQAPRWVAHCRAFSARLGIAFDCLDVQVEPSGEGIEAAARRARYAALENALKPGEVLVLAQHADDQAETFLIQALRGAGVAGLAAMPERAAFGPGWLWRPLLALPRSTLRTYADTFSPDWVDDPSNCDSDLDRGYLRENLWPQLTGRWPSAAQTLARSARWCAEANALVSEVAAQDAQSLMDVKNRIEVAGLKQLSDFRQGGLLRYWLAQCGFDAPDRKHIAEIRHLLSAREHAGPVVKWGHTEVRLFDGHLYAMRPLPPRPRAAWQAHWNLNEPLKLPDGCGWLSAAFEGQPAQAVDVCFRQGGERYVDTRRGGTRTLKAFLQEARIPPWIRQRLPLIYFYGHLVAIADYWLEPAFAGRIGLSALRFSWWPTAAR